MARYRKKPIEVEAYKTDKEMIIHTLEGDMKANVGDYIITGIKGEQYPCKPEIFEATYEISTEDVVPKSETKCIYAYDDEVEEYCVQSPCGNYKTIEQIKSEVVREIFKNIDGITDLFAKGIISELEMYDMLANLKKKYPESEDKE